MRRFVTMVALGLMALAGSAAAQTGAADGFEIDTAPGAQRGRAVPISGNAAYGATYYDEEGWYTAVLPPEHVITNGNQPGAKLFDVKGGGNVRICSAARFPGGPDAGKRLSQLQAQADRILDPAGEWGEGAAKQIIVEDRRMIDLTDGAKGRPVRVALFSGPLRGRNDFMALGVVLTPKGALLFGCTGVSAAQSRGLIKMIFRVAEGAL